MKKLALTSLLLLSSATFAAETVSPAPAANDPFAKAAQLYQAQDFAAAFKETERLAKTGNAQAIFNLGFMTEMGQGTVKNAKKAITYYEDSSKKGYAIATRRLAQIYDAGLLGVTKDEKKGRAYLEQASKAGLDDATIDLAVFLLAEDKPASNQLALQKLEPVIAKGNYRAIQLKAIYQIGDGIKTKNATTINAGLASLEDLAKKGYIPALMAIGNMMANGNIITQNLPEARNIFTDLVKNNVPEAKESLDRVNALIAAQAKAPAAAPKK